MNTFNLSKSICLIFNNKTFKTVLLIFVFFSPIVVQAQFQYTVSGTISKDNKKLEGAQVTLYNGGTVVQQITTNSSGKYSVKLEANNDYIIQITKPGYIVKKLSVSTQGLSDFAVRSAAG